MTNKEAIAQLQSLRRDRESFLMPTEPDSVDIFQCDIDAIDMAITALRAQQERNDLLTLEELREMPLSKRVWVKVLKRVTNLVPELACFKKCESCSREDFACRRDGCLAIFNYSGYGKTWLAYRHKPKEE